MFERFTQEARAVVSAGVEESSAQQDGEVRVVHLLLGLVERGSGLGGQVLRDAGLDAPAVREHLRQHAAAAGGFTAQDAAALRTVGIDLEAVLGRIAETLGPDVAAARRGRRGRTRLAPGAKKTLQLALREAVRLGSTTIGSEHVLLGMLRCDDREVSAVLAANGVTATGLRDAVDRASGRAA